MKHTLLTFLVLITGLSVSPAEAAGRSQAEAPDDPKRYSFEHRLIFFAVLEGLFNDGVSSEDLTKIIPEPGGMVDPEHLDRTNFIYACPVCHAAFEAFRLYGRRQVFVGQKGTAYNTFGQGLDAKTRKALGGTQAQRREAIREMIARYVKQRMEAMAFSAERRAVIDGNLDKMRKDGLRMLEWYQGKTPGLGDDVLDRGIYGKTYRNWESCVACDGACSISPKAP